MECREPSPVLNEKVVDAVGVCIDLGEKPFKRSRGGVDRRNRFPARCNVRAEAIHVVRERLTSHPKPASRSRNVLDRRSMVSKHGRD
jgi:hypothetical protein